MLFVLLLLFFYLIVGVDDGTKCHKTVVKCIFAGKFSAVFRLLLMVFDFYLFFSVLPCFLLLITYLVYLLCRWERHLTGFPCLEVVDRWPEAPKRACYYRFDRFLVIGRIHEFFSCYFRDKF